RRQVDPGGHLAVPGDRGAELCLPAPDEDAGGGLSPPVRAAPVGGRHSRSGRLPGIGTAPPVQPGRPVPPLSRIGRPMTVIQTIVPVTHDLGDFEVRRALPAPRRTMVGPFIFVDQFGPARLEAGKGMDVRPHPHINLATVTWLFEGAIDHRDSVGSFATIRPGQVNLMTAGRGIVHSERSPPRERADGPQFYGMQTWLALPDGREEIEPAFEAVTGLPVVEQSGTSARVIMGSLWGT